mmetsp:Transcript_23613/g.75920  ORF Transcript_23613/g.75920 Transcript_23613/m.75920 type:complete len:168 (-) Transcript_23613:101-604(-)
MIVGPTLGSLICNLLGLVYPAYASYKVVQTHSVDAYMKWLMYWTILSLFALAELFVDPLSAWIPLYYEMKIGFIAWLAIFDGAATVYTSGVVPILDAYEPQIDRAIEIGTAYANSQIGLVLRHAVTFVRERAVEMLVWVQMHLLSSQRARPGAASTPAGADDTMHEE